MPDTRPDAAPTRRIPVRTFHAPWGHCVIFGGKNVENRSSGTDERFLDWFWVHQGKTMDPEGEHLAVGREMVLGAILGAVKLVKIVEDSPSQWAIPGMSHWVLEDPRALPQPVRLRGQQNWWYLPEGVELPHPETLAPAPLLLGAGGSPVSPVRPVRRGGMVISPDTGGHRL
jgi:hypothetical protein